MSMSVDLLRSSHSGTMSAACLKTVCLPPFQKKAGI